MGVSLTPTMSYKIDWLTFTVDQELDKDFNILKALNYDLNYFDNCSGRYFFNSGLTLGKGGFVTVYFNDLSQKLAKNTSFKHCYVFTGVGTSDLDEKIDGAWIELFKKLLDWKCKITRLDLALDDFRGFLNFEIMEKKLDLKHFKSSKRSYNVVKERTTTGEIKGETIYVGGRSASGVNGNSFLRCYKKLQEVKSKHQILPKFAQIAEKTGIWQRYEIQLTKAKAVQAANAIVEKGSIGLVYTGILKGMITFLDPVKNRQRRNYKDKRRWKVSPWWSSFLKDAETIQLTHVEQAYDLGTVLHWLKVSVVPTFQMVSEIFEERGFDLAELMKDMETQDFSKKLKKLALDCETMPDDTFRKYLLNFVGGGTDDKS